METKKCKYHVVWIPKYRRKLLKDDIKYWVEKSLLEEAKKLDIKIEVMKVMLDHVHLFISIKTKDSISEIVKKLKGFSSYQTRKQLKLNKQCRHLWADDYFCESVGFISEKAIKRYIENQY